MILEKGSKDNPTGNLILYAYVKGENPFKKNAKIIASNVVVSFIRLNENFPVATFPPLGFESIEDLRKIITEYGDLYDVVRLPDFIMPEDKKEATLYIQKRMEQYNLFVSRYVDFCKERQKFPSKLFEGDGIKQYLDQLIELSVQYRKTSGLSKEAAKYRVDKLVEQISSNHPQYDLNNYLNALQFPGDRGDELASLYLKKFIAITDENYEIASVIKKQIIDIEQIQYY